MAKLIPYSNRELDQFFKAADERADEFHNKLMQRMDIFESNTSTSLQSIEKKVSYTNGKVRKIIIALTLLGGMLLGELFSFKDLASLLASHFL